MEDAEEPEVPDVGPGAMRRRMWIPRIEKPHKYASHLASGLFARPTNVGRCWDKTQCFGVSAFACGDQGVCPLVAMGGCKALALHQTTSQQHVRVCLDRVCSPLACVCVFSQIGACFQRISVIAHITQCVCGCMRALYPQVL